MNLSTISLALTRLGWMFSPAALFAAGEQGAWYDPSDLTTLFQDSAGTTPVTAVQQPVGLMLDKSKGLVLGPERVTNGGFSNGSTGWVLGSGWSIVDGKASNNGTINVYSAIAQANVVAIDKFYTIEWDQITTSGFANLFLNGSQLVKANISGTGRQSYKVQSSVVGSFYLEVSPNAVISVDNISVKELPGNHAFQTTSASRPVLSARYNLLTKTEDFADAVWLKTTATITANTVIAPNGTLTADTFFDVSGGTYAEIAQGGISIASGVSYRYSLRVRKGTRRYVYMSLATSRFPAGTEAIFDLETASVKSSGAGASAVTASFDNEGFVVCGFSATATSSGLCDLFVYHANDTGTGVFYTGTGTGSIYVWGADLRVSNDALGQPAYQRVNTSTDYDTVGFKPYLAFDGVDDSLVTNSIDFTATDKMTVFAGVRKLSDADYPCIAEFSASLETNNGAFALFSSNGISTGNPAWNWASRGTLKANVASPNNYAAPITNVLTGTGNISGDIAILRVNSAQVAQSTTDQGTGNYGNYPLYIGRRGGSTFPYNGRLYSLIVRGAASTTAQITSTETYVNQKTGAY